jgi:hypothetical protein
VLGVQAGLTSVANEVVVLVIVTTQDFRCENFAKI